MPSRRSSSPLLQAALATALAGAIALGCATSLTGRQQLLLFPESQMAQMGATAFTDMQSKTPRSSNSSQVTYVRCVANAITQVVPPEQLRAVAVSGWEVELFEDDTANAFALPGGKIGVHTGLLKVAVTPGQLAAVLGHEVGHVLDRHSNARVSQQSIAQTGMQLGSVLLGADTPQKQGLMAALGLGVQYGLLMPYGRDQESDADQIGLELMARAGFDPNESVRLWENMARAAGGAAPPEFMSTHPSSTTRIARLQASIPNVMPLYQQAQAAGRRPNCRP
ncbi:MAG: M48 family metallopeptidase [Myxococcota bacterium]